MELLRAGAVGDLPDQAGRLLGIGLTSTDRLIRLVGDLVDVERWDQGAGGLVRAPQSLRTVVGTAVDGVGVLADRAGIRIDVDLPDVDVLVDADRVVQVLVNLLGNAVKFSDPGGRVEVHASQVGSLVQVDVTDRGRGIPTDKLASVFGRFEQVDPSATAERLGSGLGLGIARAIVEAHCGRVWVDSREGEGSSFHFTLPDVGELAGDAVLATADGVTVGALHATLRAVVGVVGTGHAGKGTVVVLDGGDDARADLLEEVLRSHGLRVVGVRTVDGLLELAGHETVAAVVVSADADLDPVLDALGPARPRAVLVHGPAADDPDLRALVEGSVGRLVG
jgi:hypothetical protein